MTKNTLSRRGFLASTAGAAASGLILGTPSLVRAATPIRVGIGSDPVYSAWYIAQHEGMFEAAGVAVDVQLYTAGGDAMNAVVAQQLDVASASEPTSMIRMARAPMRPLCISYESGKYIKLVLRNGITTAQEIKNFGVVRGSVSEYCTGLVIQEMGLDAGAINMVESGPPELPALLARGDIDAFFAWEPWPTVAVAQGGHVLLGSGEVGYKDTIWVTASEQILKDNPEGLQAMLAVLAQASEIAQTDPERTATAVNAITTLPLDTTKDILKMITLVVRDFTPEDFASYDGIAKFLGEQGSTEGGALDYRPMMQTGFFKG